MQDLFAVKYAYLIPLLPLIGAMLAGFFGAKFLKQQSHLPIWAGVAGSALISFSLLFGMFRLWQPESGHAADGATTHATREVEGESASKLAISQDWFTWIQAGDPRYEGTKNYFRAAAGFFFDPLTAVMLCVITGIGFLITVFAAGYMKGESGYFRFFAYLGLFIFAMTMLVMGNNLIVLYLGWEGVGLCSYLLIGYYYEKPAAREAAKKAFLVNRIGDFGFGIGIMLCFLVFGTVTYFGGDGHSAAGLLTRAADTNFITSLPAWKQDLVYWIPFCLMLGAFGKSAQFPLYVWLPDAMEGPTPVSALIHAATMVTAGIYMIARCGTLFYNNPAAMATITFVGAFTALFAATIALRQFDLKKVFAYSTISQLGFMFVGVGVLAPVAGVFHLVTHAFFKALLFLSSGVVMHAMAGELDMRKMSGLRRVLPLTNIVILIGCLALAGFPGLSGFFSKDEIVGAAFRNSTFLGLVMLFTAFLTAYYTFRLYFRVFQGPLVIPEAPAPAHAHGPDSHADATASESARKTGTAPSSGVDVGQTGHAPLHEPDHSHGGHGHGDGHHNHEPMVMMLPLILLAAGALLAGLLNWPEFEGRVHSLGSFLGQSPSFAMSHAMARGAFPDVVPGGFGQEAPASELHAGLINWVMVVSSLVAIAGIGLAYLMHLRDRRAAERLADHLQPLTDVIEHKYWVDEIYQATIVEPLRALGKWLYAFDRFIIDGIVNLLSFIPQLFGFSLKLTVQRGYLQGYAAAMLFGILAILLIVFL